jgi:glucose-6-phosphate 1-dehydrogenase
MPAVDPDRCVRGQYRGYTDIDGVAKNSGTETFVAMRVEIDNWRWAGVPIFLRAGKALPERVTEVRLFTHRVPSLVFLSGRRRAEPNQIVLRIDPDPGLRLQLTALDGDRWRDLHLDSSFMADLGEPLLPYERLLHGALTGDHQLFAREDGIEETWRIVQPLLDHPGEIHQYEPGSWGPDAARELLRGHRGWQQPWLAGNHQ